jgi:hypothetical protein
MGCGVDAAPARDLMTEVRRQNEVAIRERLLEARKSGELSKYINVDDYTRYLSSILAGLSDLNWLSLRKQGRVAAAKRLELGRS